MLTIKLFQRMTVLALMAFIVGCGNQYDKYSSYQANNNPLGDTTLASMSSSGQWSCPSAGTYNILPPSGQSQKDMAYTVCRSKADSTVFKITGYTTSKMICIYSAAASPSQSTLNLSQDRRKCYDFSKKETTIQFTGTVNYMIVVDSQWTTALESCLVYPTACPAYAAGSLGL